MAATTIKVPVELRDRLAALAREQHTTLAGAIEAALATRDEEKFWRTVADAMARPDASDELPGTLTDGLDPAEDWSDVL